MRSLLILLCVFIVGVTVWWNYPMTALPQGTVIDKIVVLKSERKMMVYHGDELLKTYRISLGGSPIGHKEYQGDMRTPEGIYTINDKNPNSNYYKNLGISYPNDADRAHARSLGLSPGGDIKIHGLPNGSVDFGKFHLVTDWTHGCIAVTNEEMEELYNAVIIGAVIDIRP
jgi:murein L,D-transpeptidase YafK